jgi:hypothetical protein
MERSCPPIYGYSEFVGQNESQRDLKYIIIIFDSLWYLSSNNKTVLFFIAVLDADPQDWASKNRMGNTNVPFDSEM